ncbi:response regulator [Parathalassolituus penaei]|uniref:Response regulator transcription factor n=1 Tax=Parathalassolituus penaei TaxID=2997323 RepID=A0A9X3EIW2_9GAMM|nr:response regulator transcription factor [Parathalassolituus penaei]MCY0965041.1 response regulator transcription factor [Parathalassolituus penaei]
MTPVKPLFVVDDDEGIRSLLQAYLEQQGFVVTSFPDGESFVEHLRLHPEPQMVILDVMLPGIDGFEVVRQVRGFSRVPIIMLTANAEETDRIVGLEMGADDYLEKPFNPRELLARIKAIRRRTEVQAAPANNDVERYRRFEGFCLDTLSRNLRGPDGEDIPLSGTDFQLLTMLLDSCGEVLSREAIAGITRGRDNLPMDRFIDVQISRLRSRLGDDAKAPTLIKTVRGKGYVFTAQVSGSANASV